MSVAEVTPGSGGVSAAGSARSAGGDPLGAAAVGLSACSATSACAMTQSSGILIQPWRIAYTTAWVRSLTASFRRIELMWFLTVCSLIDSA
jgi:hypothetical protein